MKKLSRKSLGELKRAFEDERVNSMHAILKAVKAYATLQEIMDVGREVFGGWKEPILI